MKAGLFESLTGRFSDGTPLDSLPESQLKTRSIIDHLSRLLNTRAGSISHLLDYGIPEFSELYHSTPVGIRRLQIAIKRTVEKYEPRLKNIRVDVMETVESNTCLFFLVSAEIVDGPEVKFRTTLYSDRPPEISRIGI